MLRARPPLLVLLAMLLCSAPATAAQSTVIVTTTDFATGGLSVVDLDTRVATNDVASVHSDTFLRWFENRIYVGNRFGQDNIQVISPSAGYGTVRQYSTGNASNPVDIAFAGPNKAYVSRYEETALWVVDSLGTMIGSVSMAPWADADGVPEMSALYIVENRLFVALQRLDRPGGFVATDTSYVVVVDTDADTVLTSILLEGSNPFSTFEFDDDGTRLLIGCVGNFAVLDGGIEAIDPVNLTSLGFVITESTLGGDATDVVWRGPDRSFAIVSDLSFNTNLVAWKPSDGTLIGNVYAPGGFSLSDAALNDRDELWVGNSGFTTPGLFVFDGGSGANLAGPIGTGLPPFRLTFDDPTGTTVDAPLLEPQWLSLGAARPNPATTGVRLTLSLDVAGRVDVAVYDLGGRRVRALTAGVLPAGTHDVAWDLSDRDGRRIEAGVYWVTAIASGTRLAQRVVVLP